MPFTLPNFNVACFVWRPPNLPPNPPDLNTACQLYVNSRGLLDIQPGLNDIWVPPVYLRVPAGTDIAPDDVVECNSASGHWYKIRWVERMHLGFPNEYLVGILEQTSNPTPPAARVLLEDATDLLQEDATFVLLE